MNQWPDAATTLPADGTGGALVGRVWRPGLGPSVVAVREDGLHDITAAFPTVRDLCETPDPAARLRAARGERIAGLDEVLANTPVDTRDPRRPWLLAPVDLQAVKAAGVTFVVSMLERVIEERVRGDAAGAAEARERIRRLVGDDLAALRPGSEEAAALKELLVAQGAWSQYLEVGIGPDAEIFTKAPVLAAVGSGADAGVHAASRWNNPEPEVVLAVSSTGAVVGATLGNDVNLRDVEGRSALLLPQAKDNNASAALGPFLRLFEPGFRMDDVRRATVTLTVEGADGYRLDAESSMAAISRDPWTSWRSCWARTTSTPTARCSTSAPCSRPSRTATCPGRGSRITTATSSPSPRRSWARSPTGFGPATSACRGRSASRT